MADKTLMHAPIMPIAAKPSQYGIDPALVKKRVAELPGMCQGEVRLKTGADKIRLHLRTILPGCPQ